YVPSQYFNFIAAPGGPNPPSQTLVLRNGTHGLMPWKADVTKGAEWLRVDPSSDTINCSSDCTDRDLVSLTISANSTPLKAGLYYGTITISAPGSTAPFSPPADNTPQIVEVALTVTPTGQPAPGIGAPARVDFNGTTGTDRRFNQPI